MNFADHLARLGHTQVVRELSNEHSKQVLSQRDRLNVREEQVVDWVGASREKAQAYHAKDDLLGFHLSDLLFYRSKVPFHSLALLNGLGQKNARQVEVTRDTDDIEHVSRKSTLHQIGHASTTKQSKYPGQRDVPELAVEE